MAFAAVHRGPASLPQYPEHYLLVQLNDVSNWFIISCNEAGRTSLMQICLNSTWHLASSEIVACDSRRSRSEGKAGRGRFPAIVCSRKLENEVCTAVGLKTGPSRALLPSVLNDLAGQLSGINQMFAWLFTLLQSKRNKIPIQHDMLKIISSEVD